MSKMKYCILCGDDVEEQEHKVCAWHAICEKNEKGKPKYHVECLYTLKKYHSVDLYMDQVRSKKKKNIKYIEYVIILYFRFAKPNMLTKY